VTTNASTSLDEYVPQSPPGRASLRQAIPAEWTKFWSVRSTGWSLFALVLATIGIGALSTNALSGQPFPEPDAIRRILVGFNLGQFAVGVLGVLFISAEYGTGQIRSTLAAQPRRHNVLAAKAIIVGAVTLVVGEFLSFVTFLMGHLILSGSASQVSMSQTGVVRVLVESGVYLALMALIGLGLGSFIRNTAGAIATFAGLILILSLLINAIPTSIQDAISRYLPGEIGATVFAVSTPPRLSGVPTF